MAKFIIIDDSNDLVKIKNYVKDNLMCKFYFTPKLFSELIERSSVKCTLNLDIDLIKKSERKKIDLMCTAVFNKVYEKDVIRVDAININNVLCQLAVSLDAESVIFGVREEYRDYIYSKDVMKGRVITII